jgi:cytochrome c oxidase assembly protein subunit 15
MRISVDSAALSAASASLRPAIRAEQAVAYWLLASCFMIFAMVVIGGVTRLTFSGLSITEWRPLTGAIPPLSETAWAAEFEKYRQIPQYKLLNSGMSLADFKYIYLWEYVHRLWGRLIGVTYALPLLWFVARRQVPRRLVMPLAGIFLLGAAQGALGWYMVESGLADRVEVSQYRLVAHLLMALLIYAATLWIALGVLERSRSKALPFDGGGLGGGDATALRQSRSQIESAPPTPPSPIEGEGAGEATAIVPDRAWGSAAWWRRAGEAVIALVALTIAAGGFVAGLHAGLTYNTFPLMDGSFVPAGYAQLQPFARNWFENIPAVQFDHRLLAETAAGAVALLWLLGRDTALPRRAVLALHALAAAALLQFALGVSTLLLVVPIPLAAAHQAGAVLLLTAAVVFRHALRPPELDLDGPAAI